MYRAQVLGLRGLGLVLRFLNLGVWVVGQVLRFTGLGFGLKF